MGEHTHSTLGVESSSLQPKMAGRREHVGLLLAVVLVSLLMTSHGLPRPENEDEENEDEVAAYDEGEKLIIVTKKICLCCIC